VKYGGMTPQKPHVGPQGDGSAATGMCGMNCPAHHSGPIDRQELQPTKSMTACPPYSSSRHKSRDPTTTFNSEQECVDWAVGGGTLVAWADVRLGFEDSASVMCVTPLNPDYCISQDVRVYNDGSVPVTVSVSLSGTYDETPTNSFARHLINTTFCTGSDDGVSSWSASCTVQDVPAGGSTFVARMWAYLGGSHAGSASVTASSSPDPDSSNDTVSWNFTAPTPG